MAEELFPAEPPSEPAAQTPASDLAGDMKTALAAAGATPTLDEPSSSAPPDAAASAPAAPPSAPPVEYTGLADYAKEQGVDLGTTDNEQAFRQLVDAYKYQQATQTYQPYVQQYIQHAPQFNEWLAKQSQPTPAAPQAKAWQPPISYDEAATLAGRYTERDPETGQSKWKADAPLDARQKVENYNLYQADWQQKLFHDPYKALQPIFQELMAPLLAETQQKAREEAHAQAMISRNQDWLYQADPVTKQIVNDPRTGQPALSPAGQIFASHIQMAQKLGIKSMADQEMYALKLTNADLLDHQPQQPAPANPADAQQARNDQFQQQANRRPNNGTPVVNGTMPTPQKGLTLLEMMRADIQSHGVDPGREEALQLGIGV